MNTKAKKKQFDRCIVFAENAVTFECDMAARYGEHEVVTK
jgi:hypothetical protein